MPATPWSTRCRPGRATAEARRGCRRWCRQTPAHRPRGRRRCCPKGARGCLRESRRRRLCARRRLGPGMPPRTRSRGPPRSSARVRKD
ncbi:MAG: DUF4880 domain-containing protein [Kiritimatiellae bacterium]|nr:DUF4880 domain-containing protein [Kiritimatiellia bacterium]